MARMAIDLALWHARLLAFANVKGRSYWRLAAIVAIAPAEDRVVGVPFVISPEIPDAIETHPFPVAPVITPTGSPVESPRFVEGYAPVVVDDALVIEDPKGFVYADDDVGEGR